MAKVRNGVGWKLRSKRKRKAFRAKVSKANADYDKQTGGIRVIPLRPAVLAPDFIVHSSPAPWEE